MNIDKIDINNYNSSPSLENKVQLGEVQTPYHVAQMLLDMLPPYIFENKNLKWFEPGAGKGNISIILYHMLYKHLSSSFVDESECKKHILKMITQVEINHTSCSYLKSVFHTENVIQNDFLQFDSGEKYDIVFGNPPFNSNGLKKVPTNSRLSKTKDGSTIWCDFVRKGLDLLCDDGYMCFIIPCIWMKPDKAGIYDLLTSYNIVKIRCFTNTETNALFYGEAQTPSVFMVVQKTINLSDTQTIDIFDRVNDKYIPFTLYKNMAIPVFSPGIINKIYRYTQKVGCIEVDKSNMPHKHIELCDRNIGNYTYTNIKSCVIQDGCPKFDFLYSIKPCAFYNTPKIIMAHGMYGFPYVDYIGEYGIANRDKYVIVNRTHKDMDRLSKFLSTKSSLMFFETTKYRMKYLEKYIFSYIPDITKLKDFPSVITDDSIAEYFGFNELERKAIQKQFKTYGSFSLTEY